MEDDEEEGSQLQHCGAEWSAEQAGRQAERIAIGWTSGLCLRLDEVDSTQGGRTELLLVGSRCRRERVQDDASNQVEVRKAFKAYRTGEFCALAQLLPPEVQVHVTCMGKDTVNYVRAQLKACGEYKDRYVLNTAYPLSVTFSVLKFTFVSFLLIFVIVYPLSVTFSVLKSTFVPFLPIFVVECPLSVTFSVFPGQENTEVNKGLQVHSMCVRYVRGSLFRTSRCRLDLRAS